MLKLILFEIKKIWNTIFFRILLMALLLFFIGYYVFVYINTTRVEDEMKPIEDDIQRTEQVLAEDRKALETAEEEKAKELESNIEFNEEWLEKRKNNLKLLEEENWDALLQIEIDENEPWIGIKKIQNETHTYTHPTLFAYETYVDMSKWMQERDIVPLLPWNIHFAYLTFYDQEVSTTSKADSEILKEFLRDNSNKYSSTSVHYLFRLFGILFSFIGAVFFLFLVGDIVTKEGLGRNGPIFLLQTQPIGRNKIIASKFLTAILVSFLILACSFVFSIIVGSLFDRFGDWDYPVVIYGEDRTFTLMSMGTFILKAIGMFMLILVFCYSILFLFSILTKRVLVAIGLTIITIFIGINISEGLVTTFGFAHFIPFQYFSVFDVLTNELSLTLDRNFNLSYSNGLISLSVASLILFAVTYVVSIVQTKFGN